MAAVQLDAVAPDFTLQDFQGRPFHLASFRGAKSVVLVFNRGFM